MTATSLDVDRVRRALHRIGLQYPSHDRQLGGPHCNCDADAATFMAAYDMEAEPGGNPVQGANDVPGPHDESGT